MYSIYNIADVSIFFDLDHFFQHWNRKWCSQQRLNYVTWCPCQIPQRLQASFLVFFPLHICLVIMCPLSESNRRKKKKKEWNRKEDMGLPLPGSPLFSILIKWEKPYRKTELQEDQSKCIHVWQLTGRIDKKKKGQSIFFNQKFAARWV